MTQTTTQSMQTPPHAGELPTAGIFTVTLNPAVDVATSVERLVESHKMRCTHAQRDPGGGGINVARVIQRLSSGSGNSGAGSNSGNCVALYLAGGATGQMLRELLDAEHVKGVCIEIAGETRENFSVRETSTGREYRFVLPGPTVTAHEWQACADYLASLDPPPRYLVLSGSLPPGLPADAWAQLARTAKARGTRVVVDTSGPALAAALDAGVYLVKPSLGELRALTGRPLDTEPEWREAARQLVREGRAQRVALTLGERGALLVSEDRTLSAPALDVPVSSSIGAGDSFLGAMVWALNRQTSLDAAFRYALAAASATLLTSGTRLCSAEEVERMAGEMAKGGASAG